MHNIPQVSVADPTVDTSAPEWDAVQTGLRWNLISVITGFVGLFSLMFSNYFIYLGTNPTAPAGPNSVSQVVAFVFTFVGLVCFIIYFVVRICSFSLCCITPYSPARNLSIICILLLVFNIYFIASSSQQIFWHNVESSFPGKQPAIQSLCVISALLFSFIQHLFFCTYLLSLGYYLRACDLVYRIKSYLVTLIITIVVLIVIFFMSFVILSGRLRDHILPLIFLVSSVLGFGFIAYRYIWALLGTQQLFRTKP